MPHMSVKSQREVSGVKVHADNSSPKIVEKRLGHNTTDSDCSYTEKTPRKRARVSSTTEFLKVHKEEKEQNKSVEIDDEILINIDGTTNGLTRCNSIERTEFSGSDDGFDGDDEASELQSENEYIDENT